MEVVAFKDDNSHKAEVEALKLEVEELKTELVLCKTNNASGAVPVQVAHKVDGPKAKSSRAISPLKKKPPPSSCFSCNSPHWS